MTKTVVFDLDDTIVKEIEYLKSAFNSIAELQLSFSGDCANTKSLINSANKIKK